MYIIINNTKKTKEQYEGNFPQKHIESLLENNNDIIVISKYSNTIKIPNGSTTINGITEYHWKEYPY